MRKTGTAVANAIMAAVCYGISAPVAKLLQTQVSPGFLAAYLYLGSGIGMGLIHALKRDRTREARLSRADLPYAAATVLLDTAAPLLLMFGISLTSAATASLLGNFEIVATSAIALVAFHEAIGRRMWLAIALITVSSILLSLGDFGSLSFSPGALLVLGACICWGIDNNCTSRLSLRDPMQIVIVKGFGSGIGALAIAAIGGGFSANVPYILASLALGFVSYGLSVYFYILAQRHIGAARTSAYYAFAPFVGVAISLFAFREKLTVSFAIALALMVAGAWLSASERHVHSHVHEELEHEHRHRHDDGHHTHEHMPPVIGEHSHTHVHDAMTHSHVHTPDSHHSHTHSNPEK